MWVGYDQRLCRSGSLLGFVSMPFMTPKCPSFPIEVARKWHGRYACLLFAEVLGLSSVTFPARHTRSTGCARKIGVHDGLVGGVLVKVLDDDVGAHGGLFTGRLNP